MWRFFCPLEGAEAGPFPLLDGLRGVLAGGLFVGVVWRGVGLFPFAWLVAAGAGLALAVLRGRGDPGDGSCCVRNNSVSSLDSWKTQS